MMKGVISAVVLVACVVAAVVAAPSRATPPMQARSFVVATLPLDNLSAAIPTDGTTLEFCTEGIDDPTPCQVQRDPTLIFPIGASPVGSTLWADTSTAQFATNVASLTNGIDGYIVWMALSGNGGSGHAEPESTAFASQPGPDSSIDLKGYTLDGIGARVDSLSIQTPAEGPPYALLNGVFLFRAVLPDAAGSCMSNGWQHLRDASGDPFRNLGDCLRYAHTGN